MNFFLIILSLIYQSLCEILIIGPNNPLINALTTYNVSITQRNDSLDTTGSIIIIFPSDLFTTSQLSSVTCSPYPCTVIGTNIKIPATNIISPFSQLNFTIMNIINPSSTIISNNYTYQILNGASTVIQSNYTSMVFSPGSLSNCQMTFNPNYVRKYGTATISITPGNPILTNGSLQIYFPTTWNNIPSNFSQLTLNTSSLNCAGNGSTISSTILPCSYSSNYISINNIFNASTTATFLINISSVLSLPICLSDIEISVATLDSYGNYIDSVTNCTVIGPNPNIFTITNSLSPIYPSTNISPSFSFVSTDVLAAGDVIGINVDGNSISFVNNSRLTFSINDGISASANNFITLNSTLSNSTMAYYIINSTVGSIKNSNANIALSGISYLAPSNSRSSNPINISFYRNGGIYMTGQVIITPSTGSLNNLTLIANNYLVNQATYYSITFTTYSSLSSTAQILIRIPSSIITTNFSKSCVNVIGTNISSSPLCTMNDNVLTVSNIFSSSFKGGNSINISFDGVTNPMSSAPTSAFQIYTYYDSSGVIYAVDKDVSTLTLTSTPDTIQTVSISSSFPTVGASSNYMLSYTLKNQLPINSFLIIGLPVNISLVNIYSITANVAINSVSKGIIPTYISTQTVNYSSALNFTGISNVLLPSGTILLFTFGLIINPNSTRPTNSFSVFTYDTLQYLIQSQIQGITTSMTTPASFNSLNMIVNPKMNGQSGYYLFLINPSVNLPKNSILTIQVPSQIGISSLICIDSTNSYNLNCNLSNNLITIILNQSLGLIINTTYQFQISTFTNPRTFNQSGSFNIFTYNDASYLVNYHVLSGIINSYPNYVINFTSQLNSPSQSFLNSSQIITFNFTTTNYLISTDYIQLSFPTGYSFNASYTGSVCSSSQFTCIPTSISNNLTIHITSNFTNTTVFSIQINGYISPAQNTYSSPSFPFLLNTYQNNGNIIDTINFSNLNTLIYFTLSCDFNCQTCTTNQSYCLTCYNSLITANIYLSNNTCVSTCPNLFYPNASSCISCVIPCLTCNSVSNCLSCVNSSVSSYYYFYFINQSCLDVCPSGYYGAAAFNYTCIKCNVNCLTCQNLDNNCTSCNSSQFLNGTVCIAACSTGYYNVSNICYACDISCYTCINMSIQCLICATGYVVNGTICSNTCPAGTVIYNGSCQCSSICATCSGTYDNCLTCNISSSYPYYYLNYCLALCPTGTYINSSSCSICPTNCSSCYSNLSCSNCSNNYYLYNFNCIISCPAGTYTSINLCSVCSAYCSICSIIATNCTSCIQNYSLQGNNCVQNCSIGLPISSINGYICTSCTNNCSTCNVSLDNCLSCISSSNTSLYGTTCVANCPLSTLSVNNICKTCQDPCLTCTFNLQTCLSCLSNYSTINSSGTITCTQDCLSLNLFNNGSQCVSCQSPCASCINTSTTCVNCIFDYYFLNNNCISNCSEGFLAFQGNCITSCPTNYIPENNTCIYSPINNTTTNTTNSTNNNTLQNNATTTLTSSLQSKLIPFPFSIGYCIIFALSIISKISSKDTFIPGMVLSLNSIIEFLSWGILFYLLIQSGYTTLLQNFSPRLLFSVKTNSANLGLVCILISGLSHYFLNLLNLILYCKYIKSDSMYAKWLNFGCNQGIQKITLIINLLITHKFINLPFSKIFGLSYFKAPLSNPLKYTPLNFIIVLSFVVSIGFITGFALISYDQNIPVMSQIYIFALDALIITVFNLLFGIWSLVKGEDFFDEEIVKRYEAHEELNNETIQGINHYEQEFSEGQAVVVELGKKPAYSKIAKFENNYNSEYNNRKLSENEKQFHININENSSQYISEQGQKNIFNQMNESEKNNQKSDVEQQIIKKNSSKSKKSQNLVISNMDQQIEPQFINEQQIGNQAIQKNEITKQQTQNDQIGSSNSKIKKHKELLYNNSDQQREQQEKLQEINIDNKVQNVQQKENEVNDNSKQQIQNNKKNKNQIQNEQNKQNITNIKQLQQSEQNNENNLQQIQLQLQKNVNKIQKSIIHQDINQNINQVSSIKNSIQKQKFIQQNNPKQKHDQTQQVLNQLKIIKTNQPQSQLIDKPQIQQQKLDDYHSIKENFTSVNHVQEQNKNIYQKMEQGIQKISMQSSSQKKSELSSDGILFKGKRENEITRSMKQKSLKIINMEENKNEIQSINLDKQKQLYANLNHGKSTKSHKITEQQMKKLQKQQLQKEKKFGLTISHNNESMIKMQQQSQELPSTNKVVIKQFQKSIQQSDHSKININFINKLFHENQSLQSVQDAIVQFNEISPSEFNVQNQRYDYNDNNLNNDHLKSSNQNSVSTHPFKKTFNIPQIYEEQSSLQDQDQQIINIANKPKLLKPQKRHISPHQPIAQKRSLQKYHVKIQHNQSHRRGLISRNQSIDTYGYDGVYPTHDTKAQNDGKNLHRVRNLQKIYLQRLDVTKNQKKKKY